MGELFIFSSRVGDSFVLCLLHMGGSIRDNPRVWWNFQKLRIIQKYQPSRERSHQARREIFGPCNSFSSLHNLCKKRERGRAPLSVSIYAYSSASSCCGFGLKLTFVYVRPLRSAMYLVAIIFVPAQLLISDSL